MTFSDDIPNSEQLSLSLTQAKKKIMDLVSGRDHSEKELREKLALRCEPEIIDQAMVWASEQNWFASAENLTEKVTEQLSRRGKGLININQKLEQMGLSSVHIDSETELEKAKKVALSKWSPEVFEGLASSEAQKLKTKIARFLAARGFESDVVFSILKNEFKAGALFHDEEY